MDGAEAQMKTILIPQASLTYGLGLRSDKMDNLQLETSHNRLSWYGFIVNESNFNLSSRLIHTIFLVPSLRFDQTSNYGNKFSPKLGTVFNFGKYWQTSLKFNIGTSYRAPTFNDLYWPADAWTQGNPDLKPESGWDYDCGLRFQFPILNGLYWESTYFQNQMKGLIIWKEKNGIWSPENVNKAMIRGIENSLSFKPFKKFLEISGNYTFLDARNKTNERTVFNKRLVYRPKNTANINLNCSFSVFTLSYQFSYTGLRYTTNDNTDYLPSYKTSDITLNYKPKTDSADLLLSLQIKNIFDERYEIVKNMPIPGRELRLALKIGY
jgi:outer membrane cobalamin receptor